MMDRKRMVDMVVAGGADAYDPASTLLRESYFHVLLEMEVRRARRTGESLTLGVLMEDSSPSGDTSSNQADEDGRVGLLGSLITLHTREIDVATYCGGGLFSLLLPNTTASVAYSACQRVRGAIESASKGDITVSIGLASFPEGGINQEAIAGRAADACLKARADGGNAVVFFEGPTRHESVRDGQILVVEDDELGLKLICAQLSQLGCKILTAGSGEQALQLVAGTDVDLVILDVMMPGMNGFETCRQIKANEATRQIPVILLTALDDEESRIKGINSGADDFISKPANKAELIARTKSLVKVKQLNKSLVSLESALISLANAVEAKDSYTMGHTQRVSTLAVAVGVKLGLGDSDLKALHLGGILHDVGKIGVPEEILNKRGPLSEDEWVLMKRHAEIGYNICLPLMDSIGPALDVIRHHHEKLDGSSYPDGLRGDGVSLVARIMGVVDCYDAMITDRPYRAGMSRAKVFKILHEDADCGRLDGLVVEALEGLFVE